MEAGERSVRDSVQGRRTLRFVEASNGPSPAPSKGLLVFGTVCVVGLSAYAAYPAGESADADARAPAGQEVVLEAPRPENPTPTPAPTVTRLVPRVHGTYPHDAEAFTQGLLTDGARTFESTGLVGRSSLREVDRATGRVIRRVEVPPPYFAEGLALVGEELFQLTWQENVAFVYGRDDFVKRRELAYDTEGWGLCYDGTSLVMSDGSATLRFRDPRSFEVRRSVVVLREGIPEQRLNELECVGEYVYANVWQTNEIVRIRASDGAVDAVVDASSLEPEGRVDVLNGIARLPESGRFLVTGKLWPVVYEVSFEAAP